MIALPPIYNLYRDGDIIAEGLTETTFTDNNLEPNTDYLYQVSAQNSGGESNLDAPLRVHTDYSPVESVALSSNSIVLVAGNTATIIATVSPTTANQAVVWASPDEDVATVDQNGNVKAIAGGSLYITATSKEDSSKSARCLITVNSF